MYDEFGLVENDLQDRGIDLGDPSVLAGRSWRWLRVRIEGCLSNPDSRTYRRFAPDDQQQKG